MGIRFSGPGVSPGVYLFANADTAVVFIVLFCDPVSVSSTAELAPKTFVIFRNHSLVAIEAYYLEHGWIYEA